MRDHDCSYDYCSKEKKDRMTTPNKGEVLTSGIPPPAAIVRAMTGCDGDNDEEKNSEANLDHHACSTPGTNVTKKKDSNLKKEVVKEQDGVGDDCDEIKATSSCTEEETLVALNEEQPASKVSTAPSLSSSTTSTTTTREPQPRIQQVEMVNQDTTNSSTNLSPPWHNRDDDDDEEPRPVLGEEEPRPKQETLGQTTYLCQTPPPQDDKDDASGTHALVDLLVFE
jgi:hypothetical protein